MKKNVQFRQFFQHDRDSVVIEFINKNKVRKLGFSEIDCIFKLRASVHKLSQGMLELAKQIPIYHEPAEINKTEADNDEG